MGLIDEINRLRIELKYSRNRVRDLEATLGINRKQGKRAREILEKITTHRPNPVIVQDLEEANQALHQQSHFMHMLQDQIRLGPNYCNLNNASEEGNNDRTSEGSTPQPPLSAAVCVTRPLPPIGGGSRPQSDPGPREAPASATTE